MNVEFLMLNDKNYEFLIMNSKLKKEKVKDER